MDAQGGFGWTRGLVVAAGLCLLVTWGCGDREAERREKATLTIAINAGEEGKAIAALAAEYPHGKVTVVELPYTDLREKLGTTLASGRSTYDMVMLDDPWFPQFAASLSEIAVPQSLLEDILPACLSLGRDPYPNGQIRALPFVGNCQLLFYRTDLLHGIGVESAPETWSDLVQYAERISEKYNGVSGYAIRGKVGAPIVSDFLPVLWSVGGRIFEDRGTPTKVAIGDAPTREALMLYKRLAALSPEGAESFDWSEMTAAFTSGRVAFELNWPAAVAVVDEAFGVSEGKARNWGVALPPAGAKGQAGTSMAGNWLLGIPEAAKAHEDSREFILWLFDHQRAAALEGNPPTRRSVYADLRASKDSARLFHYGTLEQALERSTPRPRTAKWAQVEEIISGKVSGVITDQLSIDDAVQGMREGIAAAMATR